MALKVGDLIPQFKVIKTDGTEFDSKTIIGVKPVVLYFYPKDATAGCTAQACSFRDKYDEFKSLGAEIIGISGDSSSSHTKFAKQNQLPFLLLSDVDKKIQKLFGVPTSLFGLLPGRVTYVADDKGIIRLIFDSMLPNNHITNSLKAIKKLQKEV